MLKIEKIKLSEIKPYENNTKLHPKEQIEQIKISILQFGFNDPIAIDNENIIVEGHGRYLACIDLGCEEIGRKARLMELDPKYADCIVKRYYRLGKTDIKLIRNGKEITFAEIREWLDG